MEIRNVRGRDGFLLDEGIRAFVKDTLTLKETLRQMRTETGKIWPQD